MGSVQRLPNGGTFIDWGFIASTADPSFTEIDANDTIVWEGKVIAEYRHRLSRSPEYLDALCTRK